MTMTNTEITELVGSMLVGEIVTGSFHTLRKDAQTTRELLKLAGKRFAETPSDVRGQLTTLFYNVR